MKRYIRSDSQPKSQRVYYHYSNQLYSSGGTITLDRKHSIREGIKAIYAEYLPGIKNIDNIIYMYGNRRDFVTDKKYCYEVVCGSEPVLECSTEYSPIILELYLDEYIAKYRRLSENKENLKEFIRLYARSYCLDGSAKEELHRLYKLPVYSGVEYITNKCTVINVYDLDEELEEESNAE